MQDFQQIIYLVPDYFNYSRINVDNLEHNTNIDLDINTVSKTNLLSKKSRLLISIKNNDKVNNIAKVV